jgi:hypothetical protein
MQHGFIFIEFTKQFLLEEFAMLIWLMLELNKYYKEPFSGVHNHVLFMIKYFIANAL